MHFIIWIALIIGVAIMCCFVGFGIGCAINRIYKWLGRALRNKQIPKVDYSPFDRF